MNCIQSTESFNINIRRLSITCVNGLINTGMRNPFGICSYDIRAELIKNNGKVMVFTRAINEFSSGSLRLIVYDKAATNAMVRNSRTIMRRTPHIPDAILTDIKSEIPINIAA